MFCFDWFYGTSGIRFFVNSAYIVNWLLSGNQIPRLE
jgi:hypothetical protein